MLRAVDLSKAVEVFGGYRELAAKLEVPLTTCHGWIRRNKIPHWRERDLRALAEAEGKDIFKKKRKKGRHAKKAA